MILLFIFVLFIRIGHGLIDEGACPIGWQSSGDACVRPFLDAKDRDAASSECDSHGGQLLPTHNDGVIDDVADMLESLFDSGLLETTWLVGNEDARTVSALRRNSHGQYKITTVSLSATYPFVCSLTHIARRRLLFQQQLIPKGAPRLTAPSPSELYFHTRQHADYVALPCQAEGNPTPTISWYKNDVERVSPSSSNSSYLLSGGTLLVPAASHLSYTSFHCTASNRHGTVRGPSILLKPAFLEPFHQHRLDVFPLLDGGAKIDCQAPAHQPKSLAFVWYVGGSTDRIRKPDERVFISLDGTLHFTYVTQDDDNKYACGLSLSTTSSGHYGPFFRFRVPTVSNLPFPARLDSAHPQMFPENPEVGDTVYLECVAYGNPIPTYKWSRIDGKPLSKRASITNHGRILKIEKSQLSDATRYKCTAGNSLAVVSREVQLILRARASILLPLSDRLVSPHSEWSLECPLPSTDLLSTVEWFRDARPIVPLLMPANERKRISVDHNVIHITDTVESDSGVYECLVTNEVGVASSSALVTVLASPPTFPPHSMPSKIYAVRGSNLNLPCVYQASPLGHSKWTDGGGSRLLNKGRVRDHKGTLVIENVMTDDAGMFFCTAVNPSGKAHSSVNLIVLDKPQVGAKSSSGRFSSDGTVNITCEVELNCDNSVDCPEPMFAWSLNDNQPKDPQKKIKSHKRPHPVRQKLDLEVPASMNGNKVGRFACSSIFGGAEVPGKHLPPAPIKVHAMGASKLGVELSWKMPPTHREARHNGPSVDGYLVEMRTRSDRRWRSAPRQLVAKGTDESVKMERLTPNDYYQFRIRSVDAGALGDPSSPSEWIRTPSEPPREGVEGLKWRPLDTNTLLIEWDPVEREHSSGDHLRYRVSWSEGPSDVNGSDVTFDSLDSRPTHSIESSHPSAIVRLNATDGCRMVVLGVQSLNDQGNGPSSTDTVAFVNSRGSLRHVSVVSVTAENATHASLKWHWDGANECEIAFAVQIKCVASGHPSIDISVSAEHSDWIIGGLIPETLYTCTLTPFDSQGRTGQQSEPIRVQTMKPPPKKAPEILRLGLKNLPEGGYTTIIEWSPIDLGNVSDDQVGYKIYIHISEMASDAVVLDMPENDLIERSQPSARLDGLRLMYKYTVQVAGYNGGGIGPQSEPRVLRLGQGASPFSSFSPSLSISLLLIIVILRLE